MTENFGADDEEEDKKIFNDPLQFEPVVENNPPKVEK